MQTAVANVRAKTNIFLYTEKTSLLVSVHEEFVPGICVISEQKNRAVDKRVARNISSAPIRKVEYAQSIKN